MLLIWIEFIHNHNHDFVLNNYFLDDNDNHYIHWWRKSLKINYNKSCVITFRMNLYIDPRRRRTRLAERSEHLKTSSDDLW